MLNEEVRPIQKWQTVLFLLEIKPLARKKNDVYGMNKYKTLTLVRVFPF